MPPKKLTTQSSEKTTPEHRLWYIYDYLSHMAISGFSREHFRFLENPGPLYYLTMPDLNFKSGGWGVTIGGQNLSKNILTTVMDIYGNIYYPAVTRLGGGELLVNYGSGNMETVYDYRNTSWGAKYATANGIISYYCVTSEFNLANGPILPEPMLKLAIANLNLADNPIIIEGL